VRNVEAGTHAPEEQQPVRVEWRLALSQVVAAFAAGNCRLDPGVPGVEPLSTSSATQISDYIQDYGARLVPLPEESWESSVCIWGGHHWDVLVDLWTTEEGRSDLVMHAHVSPSGTIRIHAVYVP